MARRGEGLTRPNPPVGALVVSRGVVLGRGWHRRAGGPHAEVLALAQAGARARGATLYVTLEPCSTVGRTPACVPAIIAAGIRRVVVAVRDPNPRHRGRGLRQLRRAGLNVLDGVCAAEAGELLAPFAKWIVSGLPYVTLKMAVSLDGKIADAAGRSRWITGATARREVQSLRRRADAIMVGVGTARTDDPSLLPRPPAGRQPWRIVLDSRGSLRADCRMLCDAAAARTIIATTRLCPAAVLAAWRASGAQAWVLPARRGRVSLAALRRRLGRLGALHVLCEGGGEMAADLIGQNAVDEYICFLAPRIIGGREAPGMVGGVGWALAGAPELVFRETRRVGPDVLVRAHPCKNRRSH
ncbi:MAG: bifunctional diaminohydroxyphosphoribosylaminopyrimidine deaminase/5-amino-6-(5-phosphoribosylamino)uracil reductase RibD [Lentisphaerae bacterium]|nr:bifunctional diaminohydroxyphosphoribosylaminopyrimidine deaminase/5-amino-6-(5-phosphoribosylamino)uracil reductase RibD [Lentisphaerota bacterium]